MYLEERGIFRIAFRRNALIENNHARDVQYEVRWSGSLEHRGNAVYLANNAPATRIKAEEEVLVASFAKIVHALIAVFVIEVYDFNTQRQSCEVAHQDNALEEEGWLPSCDSGLAVRWLGM